MTYGKPLVFCICLVPFAWLIYQATAGLLGPDAGKELVLETGVWGLRFLLITLTVTPLRRLLNKTVFLRYRRMLGLFTWFYASLHLVSVLTYLLGWSWPIFLEEFSERPYMALGIIAWSLMVPLGLTSNRWAQKKLGRRWRPLHQSVYLIAVLACAHFIWLVRSDYAQALIYSAALGFLLLYRVVTALRQPAIKVNP
jgi:sulfoxide reductase heme-binding subunit YedZ